MVENVERESCVDTFRCGIVIVRYYLLFVFRMLQLNYNCIVEMISWNFYIFQICTTSILILPAIIYDIQYEDYFINLILANWISLRENL